jgi:hypothetical protein
MNENIEISLLKDSEIDEVIAFFNAMTGGERNKAKFEWEFQNAPAGKAIYVVAKDISTQKIIGTQCAIPINLITDSGKTILTGKSEDSIVHPNYRGMKIFDKMYQFLFIKCKEQGIKYLWGFTSAKKPFLKLGFEIQFDHSQSLMALNINSTFNYLSKLNSKNNLVSLSKIFFLSILSRVYAFKNYFISTKSIDDKYSYKIVEFLNKGIIHPFFKGFIIKQDVDFLNWRIIENPYHDKIFNINFINKKDEIVANLIFNLHKDGVWYLINDVYSKEISDNQKSQIQKKAIQLLKLQEKKSIKLIRTWDFIHNEYGKNELKIRKEIGYFHLDRGISFVWKSLDENNELNVLNFNLSRIATQGVI